MRVLIIVPAFNEAPSLPRVITALRQYSSEWDVCIVDDGSTDGSATVAQSLGAKVLRAPVNLGIGGAVQLGYLYAFRHGYDAAVQVDGDGQHDPQYIRDSLRPIALGHADLVVGSRFLTTGGFRSTALRRIGIRYLSALLRLRCGAHVTDPTSGFRAAGRRAIALFAQWYPSDYPEPESIALARRNGLRLEEIPVQMEARRHGRSSISAYRTIDYLFKVSLALILLPKRAPAPEPTSTSG